MSGFFDYWGKARPGEGAAAPYHLLAYHSLDVASVGEILLERDPVWLERLGAVSRCERAGLRKAVLLLLALHDLGKFSEPFQAQRIDIAEALQGRTGFTSSRFRHDSLGHSLWRAWAKARKAHPSEEGLAGRLISARAQGVDLLAADLDPLLHAPAAAVIAHHGRPPDPQADGALSEAFGWTNATSLGRARRDAQEFALAARQLLGPVVLESALPADDLEPALKRASWWLAGFAILCDWLGSSTDYFPYEKEPRPLADYWNLARERAVKAVENSGLLAGLPRPFASLAGLFPEVAERASPLQRAAATIELGSGPQLFILEDLTGSGKTEAAVALAQRLMAAGAADGFFFALPTMATANAMHERLRPLVDRLFEGPVSYVLAHSGPHLQSADRLAIGGGGPPDGYGNEEATASHEAAAWLTDNRKKALLAGMGVGTIDQALLAALQTRHAALRLLGLHRHLLVVDEVHACDTYMLKILCALLRLHAGLGGSAILLSATLPARQRRQLARAFAEGLGPVQDGLPNSVAYPLLTAFSTSRLTEQAVAPRQGIPRTLPVTFHRTVEGVVERLKQASESGACCCWIRNSVADAMEGFDALAQRLGEDRVQLFHARFALGDRLAIEQDVVRRFGKESTAAVRGGRVVVATQVVEQSLDLDFDVMVSDLCPIDLVIQRAGRLQRHARAEARQPPVFELLAPPWANEPPADWLGGPFRRTALVYDDPAVLWRTAGVLERQPELDLPGRARALIEEVFGDEAAPLTGALAQKSERAEGKELAHASVAMNSTLLLDQGYVRTGADWSSEARTPTRLGEPTTTVRLAALGGDGPRPWRADLGPRLQWPLSQLNVARRLIAAAPEDEAPLRKALGEPPFDDIVTLLLRPGVNQWTGRALAPGRTEGEWIPVEVVYSPTRGLEIRKGT